MDDRRTLLRQYLQSLIRARVFSITEPPDIIGKKVGTAVMTDLKWALSDLGLEAATKGIAMLGDLAKNYAGVAADILGAVRGGRR